MGTEVSTGVDKLTVQRARRPRSSSEATRARVLAVARIAFCETGYDHVGVRDIAARASTDAAIVIRLFGSKEALFQEIANAAFDLDPVFQVPREDFGRAVAALLLAPDKRIPEPDEFNAFRFLLRSASSPVAAPIVSAGLQKGFVMPLAQHLGHEEAEGRAALITACVIGLTTMRFALKSRSLRAEQVEALQKPFAAAIQACIDS